MYSTYLEELELLPALKEYPKGTLFHNRTDIEPLQRLGERLDIKLDVKRDDTLPLAMGGNKVRQLEYYFGQALQQKADTVLITGSIQSNYVRLCSAAARKLGLEPYIQLEARVPKNDDLYNNSGNVLLDRLLGANISYLLPGKDEAEADVSLDSLAESLRKQGKSPYEIHLGTTHPPFGALGYARAAAEIYLQYKQQDTMTDCVVIASGSGLTHSGLVAGARAFGWNVPIHGACVRREVIEQRPRVTQRVHEVTAMLKNTTAIMDTDILVHDACLAPGYGQLNTKVIEAIRFAALDEALLLDPVYTGRAMAELIELRNTGVIRSGERVTFLHTGGLPAIFAYQTDLENAMCKQIL